MQYKTDFLEMAFEYDVLRVGLFLLKSERQSPYFFDLGNVFDGESIMAMGSCFAAALVNEEFITEEVVPVLVGPPYKGIEIVTATAIALVEYGENIPIASFRKEAKDHGERGLFVGAPLQGRHCVIVDDVISGGDTVREAIRRVRSAGGMLDGVLVGLNRQEREEKDGLSVAQKLCEEFQVRVSSIVTIKDVCEFVCNHPKHCYFHETLEKYRSEHCVSE